MSRVFPQLNLYSGRRDLMAVGRSAWWIRKDCDRLLGRAEHSSGTPASDAELRYLRMTCEVLLHGPLPVHDDDRARVEQVYLSLRYALDVRADEQIDAP
jgi:hypothetical protein